jgi:acyl-CoA synthetase (AMP-forming)/AMP-acid ligase II
VLDGLVVADPPAIIPVAADGASMGEVMMRGNVVMKGYFKNPDATKAALTGGRFHFGDLGVMHPDGHIKPLTPRTLQMPFKIINLNWESIEDVARGHGARATSPLGTVTIKPRDPMARNLVVRVGGEVIARGVGGLTEGMRIAEATVSQRLAQKDPSK